MINLNLSQAFFSVLYFNAICFLPNFCCDELTLDHGSLMILTLQILMWFDFNFFKYCKLLWGRLEFGDGYNWGKTLNLCFFKNPFAMDSTDNGSSPFALCLDFSLFVGHHIVIFKVIREQPKINVSFHLLHFTFLVIFIFSFLYFFVSFTCIIQIYFNYY